MQENDEGNWYADLVLHYSRHSDRKGEKLWGILKLFCNFQI